MKQKTTDFDPSTCDQTLLDAVRKSEERYRRIVETTNEGIWIMDGEQKTTFVNQRMADMLGYAPEAMLGKQVDRFMFPDDLESHHQEMNNRAQGLDAVYERRFRRQDGSELWCHVSAKSVRDAQGGFAGSFAMFTDISEYKRTLMALEESRDLLDTTQQLAHIGGWEWDILEETMTWTDETWRIHGLEPDSIQGGAALVRRSVACYGPAQRPVIEKAFRRCVESGEPYSLELAFTASDGRSMWVQTMGRPVLEGSRIVKVQGNIMDITERKQAELYMTEAYQALKVEKERMQRYLDTADTIIVALDHNGNVAMLNRYGLELLGYGEHEIIGRNWFKTVLPQSVDQDAVHQVFLDILSGKMEQAAYHENEVLTSSGAKRLIAWRNTFLRDALGKPVGTLSTGMDITDRMEVERRNKRLQKAESLRCMAGAIAHHFNNQLHAVMGYVEMAVMDLPVDSMTAQAMQEALQAAQRASELSKAMLTYLGQSVSEHKVLELSPLCRRVVKRLSSLVPQQIQLRVDLPETSPRVLGDGDQLDLVLDHLVRNGMEAIASESGTIGVSLQLWSEQEIPQRDRFPSDWQPRATRYAVLTVSDTGCGIPAGDIDRLFDPFFTSKLTGRGLGLPVSLGIARAHDGVILVHSELGRGSVFRLALPIVTP